MGKTVRLSIFDREMAVICLMAQLRTRAIHQFAAAYAASFDECWLWIDNSRRLQ
jgi:hypothetical protein